MKKIFIVLVLAIALVGSLIIAQDKKVTATKTEKAKVESCSAKEAKTTEKKDCCSTEAKTTEIKVVTSKDKKDKK